MGAAVEVRDVVDPAELGEVGALFGRVWETPCPQTPFPLLRALSQTGGLVLGAFLGDRLVGGALGFRTAGEPSTLHSHIVGVEAGFQGQGIGTKIKLHQRRWCLDRGIRRMTWTFDPLVRRNALFNIGRLGGVGVAYHPDYYGPMDDAHNAGLPTDRVLLSWDLTAEPAPREPLPGAPVVLEPDANGEPRWHDRPDDAGAVSLRVPVELASEHRRAWRYALRAAMKPGLDKGFRWTGVAGDRYVLEK